MSIKNNRPANKVSPIYLLPNMFTLGAMFCGFYAIIQSINANFTATGIAIFFAMILDSLDGRVARLTHTSSPFGAELDSLADMISFGV
ncbi:MAG: CDP-alcohol phosphatidyltransferase family protein, partial [Burkholderiales bacterium]